MTPHATPPLESQIRQIESLIAQIERSGDAEAEQAARDMVRTLLDLHAAGLARILQWLAQGGAASRAVLDALARDDVVSPLLLLHGLHPSPLEDRVRRGLEKIRPRLRSEAAEVEVAGVAEGVVRLRLREDAAASSAARVALMAAIEEALADAAPDADVEIEEIEKEVEASDAIAVSS